MRRKILAGMLVIVVTALSAVALAQEGKDSAAVPGKCDTLKWAEAKFQYVGEKSCKMCHKAQHESWLTTPHAKAWEVLKPEEQKNAECVECHSVGKTKADSLLVNVACEACHGPGSEYKAKKTMEDPKLAAAAGLLPITEATCVRCHNKKSPTFKGFVYAEALKKGIHAHPPKEEKK